MSPSQKRAWLEMAISLAGLVFSGLSYYVFNRAGEHFHSPPWIYCIPLANLLNVLCLIGFVVIGAKYKTKNFDERELALSRKCQMCGFIGVFVFLVFMAMCIFVQNVMATMPIRMLLLLVLSSFFFSTLVISVSFLLMYHRNLKSRLC